MNASNQPNLDITPAGFAAIRRFAVEIKDGEIAQVEAAGTQAAERFLTQVTSLIAREDARVDATAQNTAQMVINLATDAERGFTRLRGNADAARARMSGALNVCAAIENPA